MARRIKKDTLGRRTDRVKKREKEQMTKLHLQGLTNKEIAEKLYRKEDTVKRHIQSNEEKSGRTKMSVLTPVMIDEIKKLAEKIDWLTKIPDPRLPLITRRTDIEVTGKMFEGNQTAYFKVALTMNRPWWSDDPSVNVYLPLTAREEALYNKFVGLPTSKIFKQAINEWFDSMNQYLGLVRSGSDDKGIKRAYEEAINVKNRAISELWGAIYAIC